MSDAHLLLRTLLIAIPALPLLAAILLAVLGPKLIRQHCHWLAILAIAGSFVCSFLLLQTIRGEIHASGVQGYAHVETLWTWASLADAIGEGSAAKPFEIDVALRADTLTAIMLCMVTFIATLVAIYSVGYMHGDRSYWRFFAYVSLFVFSMNMLVLVSNFVLLFVFWEAVGACSYLLIGFWYEKPEAVAAGKKAFLVNRVGDFGFALALFLIWTTYGSLNYHDTEAAIGVFGQARLSGQAEFVAGGTGLAICLLLLLGACGKSAQFPLHVWLPDAMEGPTPVSALIHAATMVTAGVYMVARCTPLFMVAPDAQLTVACVGGFTALMAGIVAMTQNDLKRVLAYSTISQLGYMFLALGCGSLAGIAAAMFHLFTHAFFKALLFLGAGSVMHGMGNVIDMRRFGGLRHIMPITCVTFAIGSLALAGIPPLSGFYSKDAILGAVHDRVHEADEALADEALVVSAAHSGPEGAHGHPTHGVSVYRSMAPEKARFHRAAYQWLYYMGLATAFLTAFYTFRAFFLTFFGKELVPEEAHGHAHESPRVMWAPLAMLSVFALFVGFVIFFTPRAEELAGTSHSPDVFASLLSYTPSLAYDTVRATVQPGEFHVQVAATSMFIALAGVGLAAFLYLGERREIVWLTYLFDFGWLRRAAELRWLRAIADQPACVAMQRAADAVGIGWLTRLFGFVLFVSVGILLSPLLVGYYLSPFKLSHEKFYFDEIYYFAIIKPLEFLAEACYAIDRYLVDGLVDWCGRVPVWVGGELRKLQGGLVPFYGLAMVAGVVGLVVVGLYWSVS